MRNDPWGLWFILFLIFLYLKKFSINEQSLKLTQQNVKLLDANSTQNTSLGEEQYLQHVSTQKKGENLPDTMAIQ